MEKMPMPITPIPTLVILFILTVQAVGQDIPTAERDALFALKKAFNHSLLNVNWDGFPCSLNTTNTSTWLGISCTNGRVTGISLPSFGLTGEVNVNALIHLSQLSNVSFHNNSISGGLLNLSSAVGLRNVDLSVNVFGGPISPWLAGVEKLESLLLQNNQLTGRIPAFGQLSLREFNVSSNNLSGEIPRTRVLQSFGPSSYYSNPGLCGPPSPIPCADAEPPIAIPPGNATGSPANRTPDLEGDRKKEKDGFFKGSSMAVVLAVFGLIAMALVTYYFCIGQKKEGTINRCKESWDPSGLEKRSVEGSGVELAEEQSVETKEDDGKLSFMGEASGFELNDLLKASAEGLGKGSFGSSYKAMMEGKSPVVVKRLRDLNPMNRNEFAKQIRLLAELKHPNLLPLMGYYYSGDEKLLVCKFAENGNLFERIHGGRGTNRIPFKWSSRLSAARGIARGLAYLHLHAMASNPIPHGNLKSSNVLLNDNGDALISDYGLSALTSGPIAVRQMVAYQSPEYQNRRKVSRKSDVWSYGCLLLELITGKVSIHSAPQGSNGVDLGSWVHKAVREEWTAEIFDVEITVQRRATRGAVQLLQIAIKCCDTQPENRPDMADVVREVELVEGDYDHDDDGSTSPFDQSLTDESISPRTAAGDER